MFDGFRTGWCDTPGGGVHFRVAGQGPALLLLHGFPQTGAMWARVAPQLAGRFTVIVPDLRGYGASARPPAAADLSNYGFRAMAQDLVALLDHLGQGAAHVAGHDRGGRCAHRMALDHPDRVLSLALMDIVPTHLLLDALRKEVAAAYYHWFFLAQPAPFPETLIGHDPDYFFQSCLVGWGHATLDMFAPDQLAAYRAAWRDPATIAGMCNDYRAALSVDFADDAADLGRRVTCPALVVYGADGAMGRAYDMAVAWRDRLEDMRVTALPGGHFLVDEHPRATAAALAEFLP
jgi:haloacetate dehalogenase